MTTIVIGGGAAGASCALWLHLLGLEVLLLERGQTLGGLLLANPYVNDWLPGVPGQTGPQFAAALDQQLREARVPMWFGATVSEVKLAQVTEQAGRAQGHRLVLEDGRTLEASELVLATGTRFKSGGLRPGPRVAVGPGHPFEALDLAGRSLAVLGGGDNAFDAYAFARAKGVARCKIFARSLRAQAALRARVPTEDVIVGPFDADDQAVTVNGQIFDAISVQYGYEAVLPPGFESLSCTPSGFVDASAWGETSVDGVYAAGEVAHTLHPCVATSIAHGIQVAKRIQQRCTA